MKTSDYFAELTFGFGDMRNRLPNKAFQNLCQAIEQGKILNEETAEIIAQVIKEWALSKGASHYCHFIHPMYGKTAQKHVSFIEIQHHQHSEIKILESFTGKQLRQSSPDTSNLPSGGMRSAFEARGYTAWDPSSPLFLLGKPDHRVLYIPSILLDYNGHAIDLKTPLIRSCELINKVSIPLLKLLGDVDIKSTNSMLGIEQEFYLFKDHDEDDMEDLKSSGRFLLRSCSLDNSNQYYKGISQSAAEFFNALDQTLYRLGIPIKTRHDEISPFQFELAPLHENAVLATDHNNLLMQIMQDLAQQHGLVCCFHEKPIPSLNASGKHCNWSLHNDKGQNLFDPGTTLHQNIRFLVMISVVAAAMAEHGDILGASLASSGNEDRLNSPGSPPAVFSMHLGEFLQNVFQQIDEQLKNNPEQDFSKIQDKTLKKGDHLLASGISRIPRILRGISDSNRTSPFAFTGSKFELRGVGASCNVATAITILNAAVSDHINHSYQRLVELTKSHSKEKAAFILITENIAKARNILFSGNCHSQQWQEETQKRGLKNYRYCSDAYEILKEKFQFLIELGIYNQEEYQARIQAFADHNLEMAKMEQNIAIRILKEKIFPGVRQELIHRSTAFDKGQLKAFKQYMEKDLAVIEQLYIEAEQLIEKIQYNNQQEDQDMTKAGQKLALAKTIRCNYFEKLREISRELQKYCSPQFRYHKALQDILKI